jgi:hypothetical protein
MLEMRNMFDRLLMAFKAPSLPAARKDAARDVVSARSHGNVRLQWGQYYTKKEVDERFNRLRGTTFAK